MGYSKKQCMKIVDRFFEENTRVPRFEELQQLGIIDKSIKKNKKNMEKYYAFITDCGYRISTKTINAKLYDVTARRKTVFIGTCDEVSDEIGIKNTFVCKYAEKGWEFKNMYRIRRHEINLDGDHYLNV